MQKITGCSRYMGARLRQHPGQGVQAIAPQEREQAMPAWMEFDYVDAMAYAIMCLQFGQMTVRQFAELQRFAAAEFRAKTCQWLVMPAGIAALNTFSQRSIGCVEIVVLEIRYLVGHLVGGPLHHGHPFFREIKQGR